MEDYVFLVTSYGLVRTMKGYDLFARRSAPEMYMMIARRTENRYGRSLGGSVRDSNYVPRGQARSELADRQYGLAVDSTGTL